MHGYVLQVISGLKSANFTDKTMQIWSHHNDLHVWYSCYWFSACM